MTTLTGRPSGRQKAPLGGTYSTLRLPRPADDRGELGEPLSRKLGELTRARQLRTGVVGESSGEQYH